MLPEDLVLLLSIVLLIALTVTTALRIYCENSQGFLAPHRMVVLELTIIGIDFFQALLLERINDLTSNLRKNLEI